MQDKFSVLIVEDDEDTRRNMEDILSLDGYSIRTESHCQPALDAITSQHFDSVILDWKLPDGNGSDLIPMITRALPNSPVVVVTGLREFDTAVSALRSGAYDFLTKPINPNALRLLVERIVERKSHLAEIELAQSKLVAKERLAAIGQMVAGLAHESRNVLQRSHACLAELSLDVKDMPESLKLVTKVQKGLDDLNTLLEEVREYSAMIILERRECDLRYLVTTTWDQVMELRKMEVPPAFELEFDPEFPSKCLIDCDRLQQVIRNLFENAVFACKDPGRIRLAVEMSSVNRSKPMMKISVEDDGKGVPEDQREEIFAPFFTTKTKGTGLGLAISRRIVEAHGGQMTVTASEFGGAKFIVELPLVEPKKRK